MKSARSQEREDDWMNMAPSDWMAMTPADWMNRTFAMWDKSYGDYMKTRPSDWWARMSAPYQPYMGVREAPVRDVEYRRQHTSYREYDQDYETGKERRQRDSCRRCGRDDCECYCCIGDVDLAVYSRVGEQRVIQIVIENDRHRDKDVTLELSEWTTRGGKVAPVETVLLEPKAFTIPACGEQKVTLVVKIGVQRTGPDNQKKEETSAGTTDKARSDIPLPDVDDCLTATSDLRLVGCDNRPLRIAVAILPRDCDPYRVNCGCTCC